MISVLLWSLGLAALTVICWPKRKRPTPRIEPRANREDLENCAKIARRRLMQSREL